MTEEDNSRYLDIMECTDILQTQVKEATKSGYLTRICSILKTGISSKNAASAISTFAIPTLQYSFGIIYWMKGELWSLNRNSRKIMTKLGYHHPKSDTNQLYTLMSCGGRGIVNIMDFHLQECTALANYITKNDTYPLVSIVRDAEVITKRGIISLVNDKPKQDFKKLIEENDSKIFSAMPLHGQFFENKRPYLA